MGRRKQAHPTKRPQGEYDLDEPEPSAKITKNEMQTASRETPVGRPLPQRHAAEMSPSCSKDPLPNDPVRKNAVNPLLMLEKSLKRFEPQKPGNCLIFSAIFGFLKMKGVIKRPRHGADIENELQFAEHSYSISEMIRFQNTVSFPVFVKDYLPRS